MFLFPELLDCLRIGLMGGAVSGFPDLLDCLRIG